MTSLIGYKDTYKIVSYQPKQLILLKNTISFEWISVKCDNGKINAKKNRKKKGEKWSSLQKATYLDIPGNPQVKGAPEPGVMRSPLPGSDAALQSRCLISRILKGLWKWALQRPVTRGRARPLGLGFRETWLPGLLGAQIDLGVPALHLLARDQPPDSPSEMNMMVIEGLSAHFQGLSCSNQSPNSLRIMEGRNRWLYICMKSAGVSFWLVSFWHVQQPYWSWHLHYLREIMSEKCLITGEGTHTQIWKYKDELSQGLDITCSLWKER